MAKPLIIGGQTINFKELYHYTDRIINEIPQGTYFTEFKTNSSAEAKAMTGSANYLIYRITVFVNFDVVYNYFFDAGTGNGPTDPGMALVYRNKKAIEFAYSKADRIA